jgi:hypothetical protein
MKIVQAGDQSKLATKNRNSALVHTPLQLEGRNPSFQVSLDSDVIATIPFDLEIQASLDGLTWFTLMTISITNENRGVFFYQQDGLIKFVRLNENQLANIAMAESFDLVVAT